MAGECVDAGSVWQGWPCHSQTDLEQYRRQMTDRLTKIQSQAHAAHAAHSSVSTVGGAKENELVTRRRQQRENDNKIVSFADMETEPLLQFHSGERKMNYGLNDV